MLKGQKFKARKQPDAATGQTEESGMTKITFISGEPSEAWRGFAPW